jgi:hypothetical protein
MSFAALSTYVTRMQRDEGALLGSLDCPVLVWRTLLDKDDEPEVELLTIDASYAAGPQTGESMVFELRKKVGAMNPFAMGITVGRVENNDVSIDHATVSRFHAYFQQDLPTKTWRVVDAESRNGTFFGPLRLEPNKPHPLSDNAKLRFGDIEMVFFTAPGFLLYLKARSAVRSR